jgi:L-cysteine desulfidase
MTEIKEIAMDVNSAKRILNANITKTMGCTDIGVVGYIASIAAYILRNSTINSVKLIMSEELYKNSVNVGVPGLRKSGLEQALALGILLKNPKKQLSVFESVTEDDILKIESLLQHISVSIQRVNIPGSVLYEELLVTSKEGDNARIVIRDFYDNVTLVERNGVTLKDFERKALIQRANQYRINSYDEILDFVKQGDFTGLEELFVIAKEQYESARKEIKKQGGSFLIEDLPKQQRNCLYDLSNFLRKHVTIPSRKRMLGDIYTVYGVAGSGNLGIGTLITPMFLSDAFDVDEHKRNQLVVLSFLTSVYIKQEMNVVTTLCGTGHATGSSAAACTMFAKNNPDEQIKEAVNLYLASSMGVICDGAKLSCTYKVSFAAMNGIIAAKSVMDNPGVCYGTGLTKDDLDETIRNLGRLNNDILRNTSKQIVDLI